MKLNPSFLKTEPVFYVSIANSKYLLIIVAKVIYNSLYPPYLMCPGTNEWVHTVNMNILFNLHYRLYFPIALKFQLLIYSLTLVPFFNVPLALVIGDSRRWYT